MVPVSRNLIIVRKKMSGWAAPPVCSAAVGIKSKRFRNSSSNKSRRGVRGDSSVGRLLLGYNVLRDDSVTRAGRLWTVWRVLRDSSANCEDLLRRVRPSLRLNQAQCPLLWLPRPARAFRLIWPRPRWKMGSSFSAQITKSWPSSVHRFQGKHVDSTLKLYCLDIPEGELRDSISVRRVDFTLSSAVRLTGNLGVFHIDRNIL